MDWVYRNLNDSEDRAKDDSLRSLARWIEAGEFQIAGSSTVDFKGTPEELVLLRSIQHEGATIPRDFDSCQLLVLGNRLVRTHGFSWMMAVRGSERQYAVLHPKLACPFILSNIEQDFPITAEWIAPGEKPKLEEYLINAYDALQSQTASGG